MSLIHMTPKHMYSRHIFALLMVGCVTVACGSNGTVAMFDAGVPCTAIDAGAVQTFAIEWTCVNECASDIPLRNADRFTADVEAGAATLWRSTCPSCKESTYAVVLSENAPGCLSASITVPDAIVEDFTMCIDGHAVTADLLYTGIPGPSTTTRRWSFVGDVFSVCASAPVEVRRRPGICRSIRTDDRIDT